MKTGRKASKADHERWNEPSARRFLKPFTNHAWNPDLKIEDKLPFLIDALGWMDESASAQWRNQQWCAAQQKKQVHDTMLHAQHFQAVVAAAKMACARFSSMLLFISSFP